MAQAQKVRAPGTARMELEAQLEGVHGWLRLDEAWQLYLMGREASTRQPGAVAVEIGSWLGRSAIALAMGLRDGGGGRLYAIDPHSGGEEHALGVGPTDTFDAFCSNLTRAGLAEFVEPIRAASREARQTFTHGPIDVLFVDGSHIYEDVIADLDDWVPLLRASATIAFNDPTHPGVYQALLERVAVAGSPFREPALIDNTLFMDYCPGHTWTRRAELQRKRLRAVLRLRYMTQGMRPYFPAPAVRLAHRVFRLAMGGVRHR